MMYYSHLPLSQKAIKAIDPAEIVEAKENVRKEFVENKKTALTCWIFGGLLALGACAINMPPVRYTFSMSALVMLCMGTRSYFDANGNQKELQDLDLLHYLKTGDEKIVHYPDTIQKAKDLGLLIGSPG
jgi:hypothetical protein